MANSHLKTNISILSPSLSLSVFPKCSSQTDRLGLAKLIFHFKGNWFIIFMANSSFKIMCLNIMLKHCFILTCSSQTDFESLAKVTWGQRFIFQGEFQLQFLSVILAFSQQTDRLTYNLDWAKVRNGEIYHFWRWIPASMLKRHLGTNFILKMFHKDRQIRLGYKHSFLAKEFCLQGELQPED